MKLHRYRFNLSDIDDMGENVEGLGETPSPLCEYYPSWTWTDSNGNVLACAGMLPVWQGLVRTWAFMSPEVKTSPLKLRLLRALRERHVFYAKGWPFRRCEATIRESFIEGHKLVRILGYQVESIMPEYGPNGETFVRYVWFTKDNIK